MWIFIGAYLKRNTKLFDLNRYLQHVLVFLRWLIRFWTNSWTCSQHISTRRICCGFSTVGCNFEAGMSKGWRIWRNVSLVVDWSVAQRSTCNSPSPNDYHKFPSQMMCIYIYLHTYRRIDKKLKYEIIVWHWDSFPSLVPSWLNIYPGTGDGDHHCYVQLRGPGRWV